MKKLIILTVCVTIFSTIWSMEKYSLITRDKQTVLLDIDLYNKLLEKSRVLKRYVVENRESHNYNINATQDYIDDILAYIKNDALPGYSTSLNNPDNINSYIQFTNAAHAFDIPDLSSSICKIWDNYFQEHMKYKPTLTPEICYEKLTPLVATLAASGLSSDVQSNLLVPYIFEQFKIDYAQIAANIRKLLLKICAKKLLDVVGLVLVKNARIDLSENGELCLISGYHQLTNNITSPQGFEITVRNLQSGDTHTVFKEGLKKLSPDSIFYVNKIAWHPWAQRFATLRKNIVRVWDVPPVANPTSLQVHHSVHSLSWSPDGRYLLVVYASNPQSYAHVIDMAQPDKALGVVLLHNVFQDHHEKGPLWHPESPGSKYIITSVGDKGTNSYKMCNILDVSENYKEKFFQGIAPSWSPCGSFYCYLSEDEKNLYIDQFCSYSNVIKTEVPHPVTSEYFWSPDGSMIAFSGYKSIHIFNRDTEQWFTASIPLINDIISLHWSPDSQMLAILSYDQVVIYDISSGDVFGPLSNGVKQIAWTKDSSLLKCIIQEDERIYLWHIDINKIKSFNKALSSLTIVHAYTIAQLCTQNLPNSIEEITKVVSGTYITNRIKKVVLQVVSAVEKNILESKLPLLNLVYTKRK